MPRKTDPGPPRPGPRLRALRLALGWTTRQAGDQAKVDHSYLTRVELGRVDPGADLLMRLLAAYGATWADLDPPAP